MEQIYNHKKIESDIQKYWDQNKSFEVKEDTNKEKYYCLSMLPYPSGKLHMGHVRNYTISDVMARYQRMLGKNVLHPIGWDAFGLPAEEAAIQNKVTPAEWTFKNIQYMKKQLKSLGFSYDWNREITTCKPEFYKWEQWFFIQLYKKNLVYKKKAPVNWCPFHNTILANEQVINNLCWRCDTKIKIKKISQWFIKITDYAEQLVDDLDTLHNWPIEVKNMQKNWIGISKGIEFKILLFNTNEKTLNVYTTRPDCLMGATFIAISPIHPLATNLSKTNLSIKQFIQKYLQLSNTELNDPNIKNQGHNTHLFAIHPISYNLLPIWIANFVIPNYGLGSVISVPAHNVNDWNFAIKYKLKIKPVILNKNNEAPNILIKPFLNTGVLFNSSTLLNGLDYLQARQKIKTLLLQTRSVTNKTYFKLKDWSISRQRYWGTPIPIARSKKGKFIAVPEKQLPIILTEKIKINDILYPVKRQENKKMININGKRFILEADTFDTFIESSWYYLRYISPNFVQGIVNPKSALYWLPIDFYVGGIEHAVMHLLYFRFFHKLFRDFKLVTSNEPVKQLLCQGMVLSEAFYLIDNDNKKQWIPPKDLNIIRNQHGKIVNIIYKKNNSKIIFAGIIKMSKSKLNGVNPNSIIKTYGSDSLRLFITFAAPPNMSLEWKENGVQGAHKFLKKIWSFSYLYFQYNKHHVKINHTVLNKKQIQLRSYVHQTILKVTKDIEIRHSFNTAIAAIMKLVNKLITAPLKNDQDFAVMNEALLTVYKMLYPFVPHFSSILLKYFLKQKNVTDQHRWPIADTIAAKQEDSTIIVQINGKKKYILFTNKNANKNSILSMLNNNNKIVNHLKNNTIKKIIYIPNKLINLVTIKIN